MVCPLWISYILLKCWFPRYAAWWKYPDHVVSWFYMRLKTKTELLFSLPTICNAGLAKSLWSPGRYDKCGGAARERTGTGQAAMGINSYRRHKERKICIWQHDVLSRTMNHCDMPLIHQFYWQNVSIFFQMDFYLNELHIRSLPWV